MQLTLRRRVVGTVAGVALLAVAISTAGVLYVTRGIVAEAQRRELQAHYAAFLGSLGKEAERAAAMASVVADMRPVQVAMAQGDRAALARLFEQGFHSLSREEEVEQFQFHLPPAISFYRVHQPSKFGDDLSSFRKTVVEANRDGRRIVGLEAGVAGLGIRGVVPISDDGRQVGTVEFGTNFGQPFFERFKRENGVELAFRLVDSKGVRSFAQTYDARPVSDAALRSVLTTGSSIVAPLLLGGHALSVLAAPVRDYSGGAIGVVEIGVDTDFYAAMVSRTRLIALAVAAVACLVAALIGFVMVRPTCRRIAGLTRTMEALARGEIAAEVPGIAAGDELGSMARAVEVFKGNAVENRRLRVEQERAAGTVAEERRRTLDAMAAAFEDRVGGIVGAVAEAAIAMQGTAGSMSRAAEDGSRRAAAVALASREASGSVQTVAAATEELTASIADICARVDQSAQTTARAELEAQRTSDIVEALSGAARRAGQIVELIGSIAGQTRLLALNATIEAARAGEHGRGFAVVAGEVKALADQTARATDDVRTQIEAIQGATGEAVRTIRGIDCTVSEVSRTAAAIAAAVEQQGAATREISGSLQHAAQASGAAGSEAAEVTRGSEEVGVAAGLVLGAACNLSKQSDRLGSEVRGFLASVRAA